MSGEDDPVIRPYESRDREAVRRVCFETGYMGDPIAWQWRDAESFADLFTSYYTDHEPESATVVEIDGRVVGYLLGCRDTRHAGQPGGAARSPHREAGTVLPARDRRRPVEVVP